MSEKFLWFFSYKLCFFKKIINKANRLRLLLLLERYYYYCS